jgi:ABC-type phosphate transport system substrate-binding protein
MCFLPIIRVLYRVVLAAWLVGGLVTAFPNEGRAQSSGREAIAIIVHPDVPVDGLPFAQLRRIFRGEQQFWPGNKRITLLVRAPQAYERDVVLQEVYEMSESQFRQYWIAKIFRSEVTSGPKIVYSKDMAHELVTALPGSITFVPVADVGANEKVLRIDGKLPGESGYPLQ